MTTTEKQDFYKVEFRKNSDQTDFKELQVVPKNGRSVSDITLLYDAADKLKESTGIEIFLSLIGDDRSAAPTNLPPNAFVYACKVNASEEVVYIKFIPFSK